MPENKANLSKIYIDIAIYKTFIVLNSNFYKKSITFFSKKTSDFTRRDQLLLP